MQVLRESKKRLCELHSLPPLSPSTDKKRPQKSAASPRDPRCGACQRGAHQDALVLPQPVRGQGPEPHRANAQARARTREQERAPKDRRVWVRERCEGVGNDSYKAACLWLPLRESYSLLSTGCCQIFQIGGLEPAG